MRFLIDANLSPRVAELAPEVHLDLVLRNLPTIAGNLRRGAIASLSPGRLALRDLPLR